MKDFLYGAIGFFHDVDAGLGRVESYAHDVVVDGLPDDTISERNLC